MRMKASISTTHNGLKLKDLRRLVYETKDWPGECGLDLETGFNDRITVTEEDRHREDEA
jgi:hypothetical protein